MDLGLKGRRAAVAAASSGLGRSTAAALAAEGARVAICSHDQSRVDQAAAEIAGDVVPLVHDLDGWDAGADFVDAAAEALGGLDILVVNHPGPPLLDAAELTEDEVRRALDISLLPSLGMCLRALPAMRSQGWGRIVVITSLTVREPIAGLALSTMARSAVTGFVRTLADEVAREGITVNTVQPGYHDTARVSPEVAKEMGAQVPTGRLGRPDDLGATVAYLCSDQASYVTGTSVLVDGGLHRGF
jgi:3-oxoacyl-[acyl-carrier protein] reductase